MTSPHNLTLMTYNILFNGEKDNEGGRANRQPQILGIIKKHNPQILCLQEGGVGPFGQELKKDFGFLEGIPGAYGPSTMTTLPPLGSISDDSVQYVYTRLRLEVGTLGLYNLHLQGTKAGTAKARAGELAEVLKQIHQAQDTFVCLAGDFNCGCVGEPRAQKLADLPLEVWTQTTETLKTEGFIDVYRALQKDPGFTVRHLEQDQPPDMRIDYIWVSPSLVPYITSCTLDHSPEALAASDHLPLILTLGF